MKLIDLVYSALGMFRVLFLFIIAFIAVPSLVIHIDRASYERGDRFFTIFFMSSAAIMTGMPLASLFNMTDSVSVIIITIITLVGITLFRKKQRNDAAITMAEKLLIFFLDLSDKDLGFVNELKLLVHDFIRYLKRLLEHWLRDCKNNKMLYLINSIVFSSAVVMRGFQSWQHYYLASSDAYLHLLWTKYFVKEGLYYDGIYPHGLHAALAYVSELFNIDTFLVFRYFGTGMSLLIMYGIYQFVRRHFYTNTYAPILAVGAYLFITSLPTQPWRQLSVLPQEFALVYVLPTLHFLMAYGNTKERRYLILYGLGIATTGFIHSYALLFILLGSGCYLLFHLKPFIKEKLLAKTIGYATSAVVIGFAPMGLGVIFGKSFHRSLNFVVSSVSTSNDYGAVSEAMKNSIAQDFLLVAIFVAAIVMLFLSEEKINTSNSSKNRLDRISFTLLTIIVYLLYKSALLNVMSIMLPDRIGVFLSVFTSVLFGAIVGLVIQGLSRFGLNRVYQGVASIAVLVVIVSFNGVNLPVPTQYEYDSAAKAYLSITNSQDSRELTLIAPQEQFQEIYGRGYHYQLWQLIADQVDPNKEKLIIPTPDLYIFVEKIPFGYKQKVTLEMGKGSLPVSVNDPNIYYTLYREQLEAKAFYWAEAFSKKYPDQVSIYYEDSVLKIYRVQQNILEPLNLKTGEPVEVFGQ